MEHNNKPILLLDIMSKGRFVCQMRYKGIPFPTIVEGRIVATYDYTEIERFVYQQRPSLRGKDIRIKFSNQKVLSI